MKFGEAIYDTWTGIANARYFDGKIKEGDLLYIDGHKPNAELEKDYGYGATANALVKSALPVSNSINLVIVTNQAQVKR